MLIRRREFLKSASLATASLWLPRFLHAFQAPGALPFKGRILVVLQLGGGNDGLNTVAPIHNDIYYKERPRIALQAADTLRLNDEAGLHPALKAFKTLYDQGQLGILHNVGYPNPDRSHFRSMDIWNTASPSDAYWSTGWLGRYLDAHCEGRPAAALEIDDTLGLSLKGAERKGIAFEDLRRLYESADSRYFRDYADAYLGPPSPAGRRADDGTPIAYLYKTLADTLATADYLHEKAGTPQSVGTYPQTGLGRQFQTIASLILADTDTSVYYLTHGSFDTHVNQLATQQRLFTEMNDALAAFAADMNKNKRWQDVLVVTFSEFGRRVAQNAGGGTDHGTANQMFFLGGGLRRAGLLNALPDLADLDEGDLKYQVDFRQVYATLLARWLEADADTVLGGRFEAMDFV